MIGKTIQHYKILEKLGEGGMGVVYKAEDTKLKRDVALKFLPRHISDDDKTIERFKIEAQAAAALNHTNIATIYSIEAADSETFIVMEYVKGMNLKDKIDSGPIEINEALNIAIQIAEGLSKAHEKGIVHRDIKPANIVIADDGTAKILDFGLAKAVDVSITKTGTTLGTAAYMSPEQARSEEVDHRTDIWSLGVVLYEMLEGKRPFKGEYESAVMYSIVNTDPEPMDNVPKELQNIVLKSLIKNSDERYQSANEILKDLQTAQKEIETTMNEISSESKKPKPSIAVLPFANMSADPEQEYFCDGMAEEIINALTHIENLKVIARTSAFMFKGKHEDMREIGKKLDVEHLLEGSVRKAGNKLRITAQLIKVSDGSHLWSEKYDRELEDVFEIQDEISLTIVDKLKVKLLKGQKNQIRKKVTDNMEAYNLCLKGRFQYWHFTADCMKESIDYFEQALKIDKNYAPAYAGLAQSYWGMGSELGTLPPNVALLKAKEYAQKALELDDNLAEAYQSLGIISLTYDFNIKIAEQHFQKALSLNNGNHEIYDNYAFCIFLQGEFEKALELHKTAISLNPMSALTVCNHGIYHYFCGLYEQAVILGNKAAEINQELPFPYIFLAQIHAENDNCIDALDAANKLETIAGDVIGFMGWVSFAYMKCGKIEEVKRRLKKLLQCTEEHHASFSIGLIYSLLGEIDKAFEWLEKSIEERSRLPQLTLKMQMWDNIKSDSRYVEALSKVGLKP
ncbi:protein kinase [candidate division KSB1 bacterium]